MARLTTLITFLPRFGQAVNTPTWNPMFFLASTPRHVQIPTSHQEGSITTEGTKQGATETVNHPADQNQDKAYSTAKNVSDQAKDMADKMSSKAQNMTEKAKQTMQEAWDATKNTAQRAAGTVRERAQDSADAAKQNADSLKRNINTKNNN